MSDSKWIADNLTIAALRLAGIIDQPVGKDGLVVIQHRHACELISNLQTAAYLASAKLTEE